MSQATLNRSSPSPGDLGGPAPLRRYTSQRWIPLIVLVGATALSLLAAVYVADSTRRDEAARFQRASQNATREVRDRILRRVNGCVTLLRGLGGLFAAANDINSQQFHNYVDRLDLPKNFASVRAVGYTRRVKPDEVAELTQRMRQEGIRDFHIWPEKPRDEYHAVVYLEPPERSRAVLGFDMFTDLARRAGMETARDTGHPAMTGAVTLVRSGDDRQHQGFLIYLPVYQSGDVPDALEARRQQLRGFVYGGFRTEDLLKDVLDNVRDASVDFAVYDGEEKNPERLMFRSEGEGTNTGPSTALPTEHITMAGRKWTLVFHSHPGFNDRTGLRAGVFVLIGGLIIAISLFLLTRLQVRARAEAERGEAELRESQDALRRSESRLRRLVDSNLIGVVIADESSKIVEANVAFLRITGYDMNDVETGAVRWPPTPLPDPANPGTGSGTWRLSAVATNGVAEKAPGQGLPGSNPDAPSSDAHEMELTRKDGSKIPLLVGLAHLEGPGNLEAGFLLDLSERKKAEAERDQLLASEQAARADAEAANRSKDEFLATLSHELRTPLNAILGWAQLLRLGGLDGDDIARGFETIERNAKVQAQLVEDLLDLSRIISGKLRLELRPIDLPPVIEAALDSVRPTATAKGIVLLPVLDAHATPVMGDPDRLQQVVWNLLSNAIKFTPSGGRVELLLTRTAKGAEITVSDTGQGISGEFLPYVFERLRQADGSSTRRHGGLGLGLAIVRHLVELHGGQVQAQSRGTGLGAVFTVALPLVAADRLSAVPLTSAESEKRERPLNGLQLLIVDDDPDAREVLEHVLTRAGAKVTAAESAAAAMTALEQSTPDVLVSDISMPGEDGYALLRRIQAYSAETTATIPAIALTASARAEERQQALLAGFQIHIAKPFEPQDLIDAVSHLARRGQPRTGDVFS